MPRQVLSEHALIEHGRTTNLYDLFLSLYRSVAENGISEVVREVFSPWESAKYQVWRNSSHPLCHAISEVIGNNANDWLDDFLRMRDRLLGRLAEWANEVEHQSDAIEKEVACVVTTLRELDRIVGQALGFPLGALTHPSPPRSDGYTLVREPNTGLMLHSPQLLLAFQRPHFRRDASGRPCRLLFATECRVLLDLHAVEERRTAAQRGAQSHADVVCPGCHDIDAGFHENLGVKSRLSSVDQVNVN
ncbi:MAG: hypothetical protein WB683_15355 [Candidatus Sulfotelmatobacter sp.]